jgi:DNA invertase Pin-like site-specific DNA recombinase
MRVAIYVRVSTQDQSCDLQRNDLLEYATARKWEVVEVFEDKATGTNGNRPKLKEMLRKAKERKVDLVLAWKLDRLFRSLKDLVVTLQDLSDVGVGFISLKDNIDMTTSSGRLMTHLLGAFAEFEASLIRERVRAGLEHAKAKGKRLGRPKMRDDRRIRDLRADGLSIRAIAKQLGVSKGAVQRALDLNE